MFSKAFASSPNISRIWSREASVERAFADCGKALQDATLQEMEDEWQRLKVSQSPPATIRPLRPRATGVPASASRLRTPEISLRSYPSAAAATRQ